MAWSQRFLEDRRSTLCQTFLVLLGLSYVGICQVYCLIEEEKDTGSLFADSVAKIDTCTDPKECEIAQKSKQANCWGYEKQCSKWHVTPTCNDESGWRHFSSNEEKVREFWKEADFGYVKEFQDNLLEVCKPNSKTGGSTLSCSKNLAYCTAENLYIDLREDGRPMDERFKADMFTEGQIGGFCSLDSQALKFLDQGYRMELTSWYDQINKFSSVTFNPIKGGHCDVVVERPTIFMKLDAVVNMYHHFCDFFNLYATFHVNGSFSQDVNIVLWESFARYSLGNFEVTWKAFTKHPVLYLGHEYKGKRVCFKNAIFSLLPRMVFGLFYNTPVIPGCSNSGLFKAFSEYVLGKLNIKQDRTIQDANEPIRVTFLSRGTPFRVVLNQDELVDAAKKVEGVTVRIATYTWDMAFLEQLQSTHNTDIFIGMHGAGLAHALFLPDWALLFELYNCADPNCYQDLARLRGLSYMTWEKEDKVVENTKELHPEYSDHPKFRNYEFDVEEFLRLFKKAVNQVRHNLSILSK